jgi:hypothetical protein
MPSITKRYLKDRSRANPTGNPIKSGVIPDKKTIEELELDKPMPAPARREGALADAIRKICKGCNKFDDHDCSCRKEYSAKCSKGLV